MGLSCWLFVCFLLWGGIGLCSPQAPWKGWAHRSLFPAQPVSVECLEAQLVVNVSRDLFGTGKLIRPADLTLGPENCEPLSSMDMDDVVRFEVGLHECGNSLQVTEDMLIYRTFLLHNPRPWGNLSILRTNPAEVAIECRYPRSDLRGDSAGPAPQAVRAAHHRLAVLIKLQMKPRHRQGNVSSHRILPTWVPFRTTMSSEVKLAFSLRLMEKDWKTEKKSLTVQLGDVARLQAQVLTGSHVPLRLFVDHCVATPTPDPIGFPFHTIVDSHGCLVDGVTESSSAFKAPRPGPATLQFTVDMFYFVNDSRNTIYITCHLKVALLDQDPDELNKACSYHKPSKSWYPVEGTRDICRCCHTEDCGFSKDPILRSDKLWDWPVPRNRRHVSEEADVTVGPLIFLRKAEDRGVQDPTFHTAAALGFGLAMVSSLTLALLVLGFARRRHAASHRVTCPLPAS